jgi:hypothetical protein
MVLPLKSAMSRIGSAWTSVMGYILATGTRDYVLVDL